MTIVNSELWMNIMTNDFVHTGFHKHKQLPHNTARASELLFLTQPHRLQVQEIQNPILQDPLWTFTTTTVVLSHSVGQ